LIPINNYIHIHLDEKWINALYIKSYKDINPDFVDFTNFLNKISENNNVLVTTGIIDFKLINDLKNKFFDKKDEKIYFKKNSNNFIYFIFKPSFLDLESILQNSKILVSCHGAITHAANSFNIKILDIIEKDRKESYKLFSSYLKNYNAIFRNNFNILHADLLKKINEI